MYATRCGLSVLVSSILDDFLSIERSRLQRFGLVELTRMRNSARTGDEEDGMIIYSATKK